MLVGRTWKARWAPIGVLVLGLLACRHEPPGEVRIGLPLELGREVSGLVQAGSPSEHPLRLEADVAVLLVIEQVDVDVAVEILGPEGERVLFWDGPYGRSVAERVCFVAQTAGTYRVRVSGYQDQPGRFTATWTRQRWATPEDRLCAQTAQRFMDAESQRVAGLATSELASAYQAIGHDWVRGGEVFLAAVALRQAGLFWRSLGRDSLSREALEESVGLAFGVAPARYEVRLRTELARALLEVGDFEAAGRELDRAEEKVSDLGRDLQALVVSYRAWFLGERGRYHRAIELNRQALDLAEGALAPAPRAVVRIQLGRSLARVGSYRPALEHLKTGLEVLRRHGDPSQQAGALISMGWTHYLRDDPGQGLRFLREALDLARDSGNRKLEIGALDRLGTLQRAIGDLDEALESYGEALRLTSEDGVDYDAVQTRINLGCLQRQRGRPDLALEIFDPLERDEDRRFLDGNPGADSYRRYCKALVQRDLGHPEKALAEIEAARRLVSEGQAAVRRRGLFPAPIDLWQDYAELHLELLLEKGDRLDDPRFEEQALEVIDQARSQRLYELVAGWRLGAPMATTASIELEQGIHDGLTALGERRWQRPEASSDQQLDSLTSRLASVRAQNRTADPRFLRSLEFWDLDLDTLREGLDTDTLLLRYVLGVEASHLFVLGRDTWEVHPLPSSRDLEHRVLSLYRALDQGRRQDSQVTLLSRELASDLLPAGILTPAIRNLVLTVDGVLHYLPFSVLPWPAPTGEVGTSSGTSVATAESLASLGPVLPGELVTRVEPVANTEVDLLIDHVTLHYAPAAAVVQWAAELSRDSRGGVAVVADPVYSARDPRVRSEPARLAEPDPCSIAVGPGLLDELPRLPATLREAQFLLSAASGSQNLGIIGPEATRRTLLESDLSGYRILHFATHAQIDEVRPEFSRLLLSCRDSRGQPIAMGFFLHEISDLDLGADLVTLSGCQTALGQGVRGDGLMGLTRGFLSAGARRMLVSLWSVDDEATSELMVRFYHELLVEGEPPAEALRRAQIALRDHPHWSPPFFWAGFVLQGVP